MSPSTQHRTERGVFEAQLTTVELLRQVAEIARRARPQEPERISQPAFDAFVAQHRLEHQHVPTARQVYARVNQSGASRIGWTRIVEASLGSEPKLRQTLVAGARALPRAGMDDRLVRFALRYAARALREQAFSPDQYEDVRDEAARSATPLVRGLLPTANQLAAHAGGWDDALAVAGLEPRPVERRGAEPTGVDLADAVTLYLRYQGRLPGRNELLRFAAEADFPLRSQQKGETFEQVIQRTRERWEAEGAWFPPGVPHRRDRVNYPLPPEGIAELPRRDRRDWSSIDACAEHLARFWDTLDGSSEPTQADYRRWAVGTDAPAPRSFDQHGGFTAVKERARQLRRARRRTSVTPPSAAPPSAPRPERGPS